MFKWYFLTITTIFRDIPTLTGTSECPCGSTCPDGCNDCQNSICKCKDDWNRCIDSNGISLGRCIYDCKNDQDCEMECLADFKSMQDKCPCEV